MSHKKQGGAAGQHVSPSGKRLGVKVSHGQKVNAGEVLIRQVGTKVKAGYGTKLGRDFTLFAAYGGFVKFGQKLGKKFLSIVN